MQLTGVSINRIQERYDINLNSFSENPLTFGEPEFEKYRILGADPDGPNFLDRGCQVKYDPEKTEVDFIPATNIDPNTLKPMLSSFSSKS